MIRKYEELDKRVLTLPQTLSSPFCMTVEFKLSFFPFALTHSVYRAVMFGSNRS